jgi:hypothetical protein
MKEGANLKQNEPKPVRYPLKVVLPNEANFFSLVSCLLTLVYYAKQSVRQAKLVQSSRFQSCPVKGSLQAGI